MTHTETGASLSGTDSWTAICLWCYCHWHGVAVLFLWRYELVRRTGKSDDWITIFFARIIRLTIQKFQFFWVIFCIIIFFHWIMHMLHFASELKWSRKMRLLSVFYFSFEISIACWLLSRPNWRIVSKLTIDVVTYCLQSKIKICVPENIVLQKKHCGLVINYHSICLLCTLLVCSTVMQY